MTNLQPHENPCDDNVTFSTKHIKASQVQNTIFGGRGGGLGER